MVHRGVIGKEPESPRELLALRGRPEEDAYFGMRVLRLMDPGDDDADERLTAILGMSLGALDQLTEMVFLLRHRFLRSFHLRLLDSLFGKNLSRGLLRQGFGVSNRRRYTIGSTLLETLVLMAVLRPVGEGEFCSRTIRVDELVGWLADRYGIHVEALPPGRAAGLQENAALRGNAVALRERLREIGFYTGLSDAFVSQTIRPRYMIEPEVGQ